MKVKVRNGYTFFVGENPYLGGTILTVKPEDIKGQEWKVELVDMPAEEKPTETKVVEKEITTDRMIKNRDTKKK